MSYFVQRERNSKLKEILHIFLSISALVTGWDLLSGCMSFIPFANKFIISFTFITKSDITVNDNFFGKFKIPLAFAPISNVILLSLSFTGMGKEVENLIMENNELLATK
jgi:hypothetical protein